MHFLAKECFRCSCFYLNARFSIHFGCQHFMRFQLTIVVANTLWLVEGGRQLLATINVAYCCPYHHVDGHLGLV